MERQTVEFEVLELDNDDEDAPLIWALGEFLELLNAAANKIPAEHRATAAVRLRVQGDYAHAYIEALYRRPETDEELAARVTRDERYKQETEARDRAHYEYLKRKFGE
jgi:hypothetical protein